MEKMTEGMYFLRELGWGGEIMDSVDGSERLDVYHIETAKGSGWRWGGIIFCLGLIRALNMGELREAVYNSY
jgi:hypothetical protein